MGHFFCDRIQRQRHKVCAIDAHVKRQSNAFQPAMTVTEQVPGTLIRSVPGPHCVMAEHNHLRFTCASKIRNLQRYEWCEQLNLLARDEVLEPGLIVAARQDSYVSVQLTSPCRKVAQTLESEIAQVVHHILLYNHMVPPLHHDSIHRLYTLKGTTEIRNGIFVIKVCV